MSRALTYLTVSVFVLIGCGQEDRVDMNRPNILFFLVDDQRNDVLSCAGHPIVKTPTIDLLAESGFRFTNTFVSTSICAASRASILTSLYENSHNYTFGKPPLKMKYIQNSYPYLLKKSGYHTGFIGKFGVEIEAQDSMPSEMFDYYRPSPKSVPYFEELPDGSRKHSAEIKGDQAVEYINMQNADRPFCLSISFNAVHAVDGNLIPGNEGHYPYPEAVAHLYGNIDMPEPFLSDPEIFKNHPDFMKKSLNRERYFWRWDTEEKYQVNMRAYLRMVSGVDRVIERVLVSLKDKGLDKNTVIIYSADNGYYMGNRGFAGKWTHYEESLRVPLIIFDPRLPEEKTGKLMDQMALNIDIPATILDLAGISIPSLYQGESLRLMIENGEIRTWREDFLIEHRMDHSQIPKYVGVRGERYVYANYYEQSPPYEYLHDLETDPHELKNLAYHPDYKDVLQEMRRRCQSLQERWQVH